MTHVRSKDGTLIIYESTVSGTAVIFVGGGLDDGSESAALATEVAKDFRVFNYARRGRGGSGDTQPYAVDREIEDIEALISKAGGSAHLFGVSSGGALALEAAMNGASINKIAIYEVPYDLANETAQQQREYVEELQEMLAEDRRDDALVLFMRLAGSSEEDVKSARNSPTWPDLKAIAHTLVYDAACLGDRRPPLARLAKITQPTLVITGGGFDPFEQAADALASAIPRAKRKILPDQAHVVDPKALAPVLKRFFQQ